MIALEDLAAGWLSTGLWLSAASTAVWIVVSMLTAALPRRAAALRHALLLLVVLRLVVPPGVTSPLSAWPILDAVPPPAGRAAATALHPGLAMKPTSSGQVPSGLPSWRVWLMATWALGALTVAARLFRGRRRYRGLATHGRPLTEGVAHLALEQCRRRLTIARPVRLVAVDAPVVPFTIGVARPVVVLPEALLADEATTTAVVAHELAHIKRFDDLWLALELIVRSLYFFHPLVWLTSRSLALERELACDRLVLAARAVTPQGYGRALLEVLRLGLTPTAVAPAATSRRKLTMRIHHIADATSRRPTSRRAGLAASGLFLLLAAAILPPTASGAPSAGPAPSPIWAGPSTSSAASEPARRDLTLDDVMPGSKVTSGFGMRRHPIDHLMLHHDGVDLATGARSAVHTPYPGQVEIAAEDYGDNGKFGTVVIIDHGDGLKTFYAHLSQASVTTGERLDGGAEIGRAGATGVSAGVHVHFELWQDGEKVDPARIAEILGAR